MRIVEIHRARPLPEKPAEPVEIRIVEPFPRDLPDCGAVDDCHRYNGQALAEALWVALPGGTLDHLLAELMRRRARSLTIRMPGARSRSSKGRR